MFTRATLLPSLVALPFLACGSSSSPPHDGAGDLRPAPMLDGGPAPDSAKDAAAPDAPDAAGPDAAAPDARDGSPPDAAPESGAPVDASADTGADQGGDAARPLTVTFDFAAGAQGWSADFSDFTTTVANLDLDSGIRPLPAELGSARTGFFITGNNHSDDLYMFIKKRLGASDGLVPGQRYRVAFDLIFASNAQSGCTGIGGAPGESVTLKAGASATEPKPVTQGMDIVLNVDKGMQTNGGQDASVVGSIANGQPCGSAAASYVSLHRTHTHPPSATAAAPQTDAAGNLWLMVGTDSGFEGPTALYYQSVTVTLTPVP
jgi:hypothetical protein